MQSIQKFIALIQSYQNAVREWIKWLWIPPIEKRFRRDVVRLHKNLGLEIVIPLGRSKMRWKKTELSFIALWNNHRTLYDLAVAVGRTEGALKKKLRRLVKEIVIP